MSNHRSSKLASNRAKFHPDWEKLFFHFECKDGCRGCHKCYSRAKRWYTAAGERNRAIAYRTEAAGDRRIALRDMRKVSL